MRINTLSKYYMKEHYTISIFGKYIYVDKEPFDLGAWYVRWYATIDVGTWYQHWFKFHKYW